MGTRMAFVDVDTQVDFMQPDGALYVPGAETLVPNMRRLVEYAHSFNIPIIASVDAHLPDDPEFNQFPPHCVRATPGQKKIDVTEIAGAHIVPAESKSEDELPSDGAVVLEKTVFSLFGNKNAEAIFRKIAADEYVVFGVATDYCVKAAVMGLLERGYRVAVVEDAIKGVTEEGATVAIDEMRRAGARFVTTEQIVGIEGGAGLEQTRFCA